MEAVLGYDCDGTEIYEYRILRAIWSNNTDISMLVGLDPRQYCAVVANNGRAYAISVNDSQRKDLIKKHENIGPDEEIPVKIKAIYDMENYECAIDCEGNEMNYDLDRQGLKAKLNAIINGEIKNKPKSLSLKKLFTMKIK